MMLLAGLAHAEPGIATLIRSYPGVRQILDIMDDPPLLLASGSRRHKQQDKPSVFPVPFVAVYDTRTGEKIGEIEGGQKDYGVTARFASRDSAWIGWRGRQVEWNFRSGATAVKVERSGEVSPVCFLPSGEGLGLTRLPVRGGWAVALRRDAAWHQLSQPALGIDLGFDCLNRWQEDRFLAQSFGREPALVWIPTSLSGETEPCRSFPGHQVLGYAVTSDASKVVVVTGEIRKAEPESLSAAVMERRVFLNVLDGRNGCIEAARFALEFPEKPVWKKPLLAPKNQYLSGAYFQNEFASQIAVSPDGLRLAMAYGTFKSDYLSDALAFIGIYDISSGRRLATLKGGVYPNGFLTFLRTWDWDPISFPPITGPMRFSADSKQLFVSSAKIWQWDVSALR